MKTLMIVLSLALFGLTAGPGCDSVDNAIDCNSICNRYADCFDDDYDVDGCVDRCEDNAANDEDYEQDVDACETCIDDRSCSDSLFACPDECNNVVP